MRTVYGDHERFEKTYFSKFPGYYMSGDGAKRDKVHKLLCWYIESVLYKCLESMVGVNETIGR